jgi:hypothetical protein
MKLPSKKRLYQIVFIRDFEQDTDSGDHGIVIEKIE